jgi:hypothetical protein
MINRDPQLELELKEKVEELVAQAVEKAIAVEEPVEGAVVQEVVIDEELRQLELTHLRL